MNIILVSPKMIHYKVGGLGATSLFYFCDSLFGKSKTICQRPIRIGKTTNLVKRIEQRCVKKKIL